MPPPVGMMNPKESPGCQAGGYIGRIASLSDQHALYGVPHRFRRSRKKQTARANRAFRPDGPGARLMASLGSSACFFTLTVSDLNPKISDDPDGLHSRKVVNAPFRAAARLFRGPFLMVLEVGRGDLDAPGRGRLHVHIIAAEHDGPPHIVRGSERCKPVYDAVKLYAYLNKAEPYTLEALGSYSAARILHGKPPRTRRHLMGPQRLTWAAAHCSKDLTLEPKSPRAAAGEHTALATDRANTSPSPLANPSQRPPQPPYDAPQTAHRHRDRTVRAAPRQRPQLAMANGEDPNTVHPPQNVSERLYGASRTRHRHRPNAGSSHTGLTLGELFHAAPPRLSPEMTSEPEPPRALLRSSGPTPGPSP